MRHDSTAKPRRRERDGMGKGQRTYSKHFLIRRILTAQTAKLHQVFGPGGVIIDMHAHDGDGVVTPQVDIFDDVVMSQSTAEMAFEFASRYQGFAILCEKNTQRRKLLQTRLGGNDRVLILKNNDLLEPDLHVKPYPWVVVLNDPNGHGHHNLETLEKISYGNSRVDFIVVINEGSLKRHLGVNNQECDGESARVIASRRATDKYRWMVDSSEWCRRLNKRHCVQSRTLVKNGSFHGRVNLFANYCANLNAREFVWSR